LRLGKKCGEKSARDKDLHAGGGVCIDENSRCELRMILMVASALGETHMVRWLHFCGIGTC